MPEIPVLMAKSSRFPTFATRILTMVAIVVILASCGGGGGGGASMPNTGGPMVIPVQPEIPEQQPDEPMPNTELGQITGWRNNPSAQDLLDHWNDPDGLRQGIGAGLVGLNGSDATARLDTLRTILQAPTDSSDDSKTLLRNVDIGSMTVVGERDGITYGQWKSGPAGTLDIDFDYRFAPELDSTDRAMIERAGKSWSWRLGDDFGIRTIDAGQRIARSLTVEGITLEELRLDEEVTTDGHLVFVDRHDGTRRSLGGKRYRTNQSDIGSINFEPLFGYVRLGQPRFDEVSSRGNLRLVGLIAHEIGHTLGITLGLSNPNLPLYNELVDEQAGTFNGPRAVEANGGRPVPFQWLDANRRSVAPGTIGASIDPGHLGPCTSVMSYCRGENNLYAPSELDFAFLADIGYEVLDKGVEEEPEVYGFGAWGRYSAWGAGVERTISYQEQISGGFKNLSVRDSLRAGADAFGIAPTTSLTDEHGPQGSVTWSGSLIGVDLGSPRLAPVFGVAEVTVDLTSLDGTAEFNNLTVVNDGQAAAFRMSNLNYAIEVTGNTFSDSGGRIGGGFFGPAQEEMAGVLRDEATNVNLLGGFGGKR